MDITIGDLELWQPIYMGRLGLIRQGWYCKTYQQGVWCRIVFLGDTLNKALHVIEELHDAWGGDPNLASINLSTKMKIPETWYQISGV